MHLHELLQDFLDGNLVNNSESIEPLEFSVYFFESSYPIRGELKFIVLVNLTFVLATGLPVVPL